MNLTTKIVSMENRDEILNLSIKDDQEGFVETTSQCLSDADKSPKWNPIGIYHEDTLIGFAMYGLWSKEGIHDNVWLDRFLIDKHYQHHGFGKEALEIIIQEVFNKYQCDRIYLSLYSVNKVAEHLYKEYGFEFNGEKDINGEDVMVLLRKNFKPILLS